MADESKNILLMIADDLGRDYLQCYGCRSIKTPHIDALAAEGTLFTNAFASTASCSGSRSTIYTGLHTHENGQYGLEHSWNHFQTFKHVETVPAIFNGFGYQTGIIGKVHAGPREIYPWEVFDASPSRNVKWVAERAAAFFDKATETRRPFHLTIGFTDPHRDATRGGFANDAKEVLDAGLDQEVPDYSAKSVDIAPFMTDVDELRTELVQYYKSISRMDLGVGLILKALKDRGLDESTLVVFVSDNGAPFINSKTTLYDAGVQLPMLVKNPHQRVRGVVNPNMVSFLDILPTTIAWAGQPENNVLTPNRSRSPKRLGHNMLPILEKDKLIPVDKWKHHVLGSHTFHEVQNYWPTRFLRTHRYKYHRNIAYRLDFPFAADLYSALSWEGLRSKDSPEPLVIGKRPLKQYLFRAREELYDLDNDPDEVSNNVDDERYQDVLNWCRQTLEAWQYQTNDAWLFKDGVSAVVMDREGYLKQGMKLPDRFEMDLKEPGTEKTRAWEPPVEPRDKEPPEPGVEDAKEIEEASHGVPRQSMWRSIGAWWQGA